MGEAMQYVWKGSLFMGWDLMFYGSLWFLGQYVFLANLEGSRVLILWKSV